MAKLSSIIANSSTLANTETLYILLGLGIVFAVISLIILIISLVKLLPAASTQGKGKKESDKKGSSVDDVIAQIISREESSLMNDHELVAVITGAIHEFNRANNVNDFAGGFVVRSIRKINNKRISY